ncbi:serine/threonine protein kinase [Anoxybacillus gonensis]|uniref:non-specific serine/threonine protein kinase n=1 Tax=Anoxybacillus gonensis TaxID=198467 RepID=A0AAW7TH69_9BACL|nr:serine/threonine-protein kinase [Anoxybacillus gonensis]AKS37748.1 serine/threonine protein kinase [Anoxybacillus gonensis]KGP59672.1 serine/threonine protein kinase [Anoxybacillus gonensis]MCX8047980.1 serine/threonine-protein kinase [Anoxybacillus gonensis]MDO0877452.1 serine/threonine-protein kinase [Anoxybacillus gonensis]
MIFIEKPYREGTVVNGRYTIQTQLGEGSYGVAYVARDEETKELVVLKQMKRTKRKKRRASFEREALILKKLNHPQIPKLYDSFDVRGTLHLVMEYIEGDTIETLIFDKNKTYDEKEAFSLLADVLRVVQYIHAHGIVHRDLRIPNIVFRNGIVYVLDFGLARFLSEKNERLFTLEQRLRRTIAVTSDIYALGHFLLFLLYSSYEPTADKEKSWEDELSLSKEARHVLRRMLQLDRPYASVEQLMRDVAIIP